MSEYIDRQAVLDELDEDIEEFVECDYALKTAKKYIKKIPPADVRPVVFCRDCKFWHDAYVEQNDGTKRKYREDDVDPLGIKNCVTLEVGVNIGAMCRYELGRGWFTDKTVYRRADDYCSRGETRPCSYDEWWGIVDGVYPAEEDKP